jgi:Cutinase
MTNYADHSRNGQSYRRGAVRRFLSPQPGVIAAVTLLAGVLAVAAGPAAAVPVSASQHAADTRVTASPLSRITDLTCPDVYFLGARGSGENGNSKYHGMGPEVDQMATVAKAVLAADQVTSFKTLADIYPADNVSDLVPTSAELAGALAGLASQNPALTAAAASYYYAHNVKMYLASLKLGIANAVSEAKFLHAQCPHALLILAGYSQGAMAMHQAELQLAASHDTGLLDQVAGTLLLGDGDRIEHTAAREFGTSKSSARGIRTFLGKNSGRDVPDPGTTANICNAGDIVCDFSVRTLLRTIVSGTGICVHESYVTRRKDCDHSHNNALTQAATWVANLAAARLASSRWASVTAPLPSGAGSDVQLNAVACPSATWCVAVGDYADSSGSSLGLLLTGSGKSWKAETAPLPDPGASTASLSSVACSSPSWCVAVGTYTDSAGDPHGLLLTWSGTRWTPAQAPMPAPDPGGEPVGGSLGSVACPSPSSCVATGGYGEFYASQGETYGRGLLLNWSGKSWTPTQAPGTTQSVGAVVCPSASSCTATGSFGSLDDTPGEGILLLTWSAGAWTATDAPWPAGATASGNLMSSPVLACPSASSCLVSALYFPPDAQHGQGVMLSGSHRTWTDTVIKGGLLYSAACPAAAACVFGGTGQVLQGSRTTWKAVTMPPLATAELMTPLACPSMSSCVIAGLFTDGADSVIVTGSGSTWNAAELSIPADGYNPGFNSMACPSVTACVAVGSYDESDAVNGLIATGPG